MKKLKAPFAIVLVVILFIASSFYKGQDFKITEKVLQDTTNCYKDGNYEGKSRAIYTGEPFWGIVNLTVKNGSFTGITFMIRDSALHETFNGYYEKHFEGNPIYILQCRNDWNGVQTYPKMLSETQNPDKVDAMSGATWSYKIFKASIKQALKNAKKQTVVLAAQDSVAIKILDTIKLATPDTVK
jgi:major membrane immunogen (membrane-anchored lipoprotein)